MKSGNRVWKSRSLAYGTFEERRLLAGNVNVAEADGNLYLRGDATDNQIELLINEDGLMELIGLDGTTINRHSSSYLVTQSKAGSHSLPGGVRFHMGPGHDDLTIRDATFEGMSLVYGGTGDDAIKVINSTFNDHVALQTWHGEDHISISDSLFLDDLYTIPLDGDDTVMLENSATHGGAFIVTGDGDDTVEIIGQEFAGDNQMILTQDGHDTVMLMEPEVGSNGLGIYTGDGNDLIHGEMHSQVPEGNVVVGGQQGIDRTDMTTSDEASEMMTVNTEATGEAVLVNAAGELSEYGFESFYKVFGPPQEIGGDFGYVYASQFSLAETTDIYGVDWQGAYDAPFANTTDSYVIQIFENEVVEETYGEGLFWEYTNVYESPSGDPVFSTTLGIDQIERELTDQQWSDGGASGDVYDFSANVEFEAEAGKKYWISIYQELNLQDPEYEYDNTFVWLGGTEPLDNPSTRWSSVITIGSDDGWLSGHYNEAIYTLRS